MQQTGHRRQPVGHGPALLNVGCDVDQPITAQAVHLRVRSGKHPGPQFLLSRRAQLPRPARPRAVAQPGQTLGVEAHYRVAQRLALPPNNPGRLRSARSFQRLRDRQRPQGCATVRLALRKSAQFGRTHIIPDHQATRAHPPSPSNTPTGNHTSATPWITSESAIVATGITPLLRAVRYGLQYCL